MKPELGKNQECYLESCKWHVAKPGLEIMSSSHQYSRMLYSLLSLYMKAHQSRTAHSHHKRRSWCIIWRLVLVRLGQVGDRREIIYILQHLALPPPKISGIIEEERAKSTEDKEPVEVQEISVCWMQLHIWTQCLWQHTLTYASPSQTTYQHAQGVEHKVLPLEEELLVAYIF